MKQLILHSIAKRKVQSASVILVVAAGVTVLFALLLIYGGVSQGVQLSEERGGAEVMLVPEEASDQVPDTTLLFTGAPVSVYMGNEVYEKAAAIDGVTAATPEFFSQTLSASCCSTDTETRIVGFDPSSDWTIQPLTDFDLSGGLASDQVLLGSSIPGNADGTIDLLGKRYNVAGHLVSTGSDIDLCIMVDIQTARTMSADTEGTDYMWDRYGKPADIVSAVLIDVADDLTENERIAVMRRLDNIENARVIERSSVIDSSQASLSSVFGVMLGVGILMVVVSILQLFARFYSMAWDRKSELALYRAVGATSKQLGTLIRGEAFILTAAGVVIGLVLGFALYVGACSYLASTQAFPFVAPGALLIVGGAVGMAVIFSLVTVLSIIAPLSQIGRIDPSLAMQQSDID